MKQNIITVIALLLLSNLCIGQTNEISLDDLKAPVSPGFNLLDISPTTVERPTTPKKLALNLLNFTGSGTSLPKNFALEFSPFWIIDNNRQSVYKFMGLTNNKQLSKATNGVSTGFLEKLSFSLSAYFNDSAKNLLPNTNYISYGVRTNIITIWGKSRVDKLKDLFKARAETREKIMEEIKPEEGNIDPDKFDEAVTKARSLEDNSLSISSIKPMLVLDGAYAYSDAYKENIKINRRFNRAALWINLTGNVQFGSDDGKCNFFLIAYYKRMWDNMLVDTLKNILHVNNSNDFGGRIGIEKGDLSISWEYISRSYNGLSALGTDRNVFLAQYKISDNLYAFGTYGKSFSELNNVFSILGLKWGFGKTSLQIKD